MAGLDGLDRLEGGVRYVGDVANLVGWGVAEHEEVGSGCLLHKVVDLWASDGEESGCPGVGVRSGFCQHSYAQGMVDGQRL